jgi:hypothetical protein
VSVPLYQAKAELFPMLGHPVRIRGLELLQMLSGRNELPAEPLETEVAAR